MEIPEEYLTEIPDIKRGNSNEEGDPFCFTDGVGTISRELLDEVNLLAGINTTALQIRIGGIKGVLSLNDQLTGKLLCIRPSMKKFNSPHREFEVINKAKYSIGALNRQIIMLLSTLGVPDSAFLDLQETMLHDIEEELPKNIKSYLNTIGPDNLTIQVLQRIHNLAEEPVISMAKFILRKNVLSDLLQRSHITVEKSAVLMGVADEKDLLEYGQVFVKFSGKDPLRGRVVVVKNPCLHPGDVRVLEAVDKLSLHNSVDIVVFPTRGPRPHPNECSGSDLDGDLYFVTWESTIIPEHSSEAQNYDMNTPNNEDPPFGAEHMIAFFKRFISNDKLGRIDNMHLAVADLAETYAFDSKCVKLWELHSIAVDYAKTGIEVNIPQECYPDTYPDFMMKNDKITHESKKVLGKLFRRIEKYYDLSEEFAGESAVNELFLVQGYEEQQENAKELVATYSRELRAFLNQFQIPNELEFLIGKPMDSSLTRKNGRRQEESYMLLTYLANDLVTKYRELFQRNSSKKLASAIYFECRYSDQKIYAFPWVVAEELLMEIYHTRIS